jgi:hypothetical protein
MKASDYGRLSGKAVIDEFTDPRWLGRLRQAQ